MIRKIALSAVITILVAGAAQANDDIVSDAIIHRAGLQVEWSTQSGAGTRGQIVDWYLNVNENKATTFYSITAGQFNEKFSEKKKQLKFIKRKARKWVENFVSVPNPPTPSDSEAEEEENEENEEDNNE